MNYVNKDVQFVQTKILKLVSSSSTTVCMKGYNCEKFKKCAMTIVWIQESCLGTAKYFLQLYEIANFLE